MSSEVSLQGALRAVPRASTAEPQAVTVPHADVVPGSPALKALEKPVIDFDPRESQRKLSEAISRLNEMMQSSGTNLNFSRDEVLNQTVITVKNTESGNVIRQIPDITFLKVAHNIESLKGLLHNEEI
jgi:flagellar protein FlaG